MRHILITGSTGMIGSVILQLAMQDDSVSKITLVNRKSSGAIHPKITEIIVPNFMQVQQYLQGLPPIQVCYHCIGVYTGAVPTAEFNTITIDYTMAVVDAVHNNNAQAQFCLLSGMGADNTEKSNILFAKAKGKAENYMFSVLPNAYTLRPGYIYPVTKRKEPNIGYAIMRMIYKPISYLYANIGVSSTQLASCMYHVGITGNSEHILDNNMIRNYSHTK